MLFADIPGYALALACSAPWRHRSAGYAGVSDGWQDLRAHGRICREYTRASEGNVALTAEISLSEGTEFLLAIGFGRTTDEAAHRALGRIFVDGIAVGDEQRIRIAESDGVMRSSGSSESQRAAYRAGTAVIASHESKDFPGGTIASLSFPWGEIQGDTDEGGYHLVWPRDSYEAATALLAAGGTDEVVRTLDYFAATQEADGHWPQNMWLGGRGFWKGIQLDESAAPILLLDLARRTGAIRPADLRRLWPMVRGAAGFIAREGPATRQDRWEEDAGLTPYTLGSTIAALLIAAECAGREGESDLAKYLAETADAWNDAIEDWLYVEDSDLARRCAVDGYYVRLTPAERLWSTAPLRSQRIPIPNHAEDVELPADSIVSADALALVRFGLRAADDPRILNTIKVIDALLKTETASGPCWYRYNHDGYGEKADGSPFDGSGIGRPWPLLVGERAHYEVAAKNLRAAAALLSSMERQTGDTGYFPEQIWDGEEIPSRRLASGRPTGSAQPLVWAHAEYIKLLRSIEDGVVFDTPPQTLARYAHGQRSAGFASWRFEARTGRIRPGCVLRIETRARARVRWTRDDWATFEDVNTRDTGIGLFMADLPTRDLEPGARVVFTFFWPESGSWENCNFEVAIRR